MTPLATQIVRQRINVLSFDSSREDVRNYGGSLDFNSYGIAGCVLCGWRGAPTLVRGEHGELAREVDCPACTTHAEAAAEIAEEDLDRTLRNAKVGRNDPCVCGSGKKAKKCHPECCT